MRSIVLIATLFVAFTVAATFVTAAGDGECATPNCGGALISIYRQPGNVATNCSLIHLDNYSGGVTYEKSVDVCNDVNTEAAFALPRSIYHFASKQLMWISGTGKYIHGVDSFANKPSAHVATLPTSYAQPIGLGVHQTAQVLHFVTVTSVYSMSLKQQTNSVSDKDAPTELTETVSLKSLALSGNAIVTTDDTSMIYIADDTKLHSVNTTDGTMTTVTMNNGVAHAMDIAHFDARNSILILAGYRLYDVKADTGVATLLTNIPDGPGFPRVNAVYKDLFFFADFSHLFHVDLFGNFTVSAPSPKEFNSYGCQGYFNFFY